MRSFYFLAFLFFLIPTHAQNTRTPVLNFDQKTGNLIGISQIYGDVALGCHISSKIIRGQIMRREFAKDEMTPIGIVLSDYKDIRYYLNIDLENVNNNNKNKSMRERYSIDELINLSNRVEVQTVQCGSGNLMFLDGIKLIGK
jgi:hypothetical protein